MSMQAPQSLPCACGSSTPLNLGRSCATSHKRALVYQRKARSADLKRRELVILSFNSNKRLVNLAASAWLLALVNTLTTLRNTICLATGVKSQHGGPGTSLKTLACLALSSEERKEATVEEHAERSGRQSVPREVCSRRQQNPSAKSTQGLDSHRKTTSEESFSRVAPDMQIQRRVGGRPRHEVHKVDNSQLAVKELWRCCLLSSMELHLTRHKSIRNSYLHGCARTACMKTRPPRSP
ncbi:hypothetical protein K438DRAFT_1780390 [Mycena galopus ATCC 62051]|nr:hypothetical protein K438DRAFT_1780390 [Mycena galopus ATCC 62051]